MAMRWNRIFCIPVALMLLLAVTAVPTLASKPITDKQVPEKITTAIKVISNTPTLYEVQMGDLVMTTKINEAQTSATMNYYNKATKERWAYYFEVSKTSDGKYVQKMYSTESPSVTPSINLGNIVTAVDGAIASDSKKTLITINTYDYNPLAPGSAAKILSLTPNTDVVSNSMMTASYEPTYQYDGLTYVYSYWGGFAHPSYEASGISSKMNIGLQGNNLVHYHMDKDVSGFLVAAPLTVVGGTIGALIGTMGIPGVGTGTGAIIGGLIGAVLGWAGYSIFTDEESCIWFFYAKHWCFQWVYFTYSFLPDYFRICGYTEWNNAGIIEPY